MKPVPNAIRTEAPSFINIAKGIFKLTHLKQFFVVIISISFLMSILRVITIRKFVIICAVAGSFILIIYIIELLTKRNNGGNINKQQYTQIDSENAWDYPAANPPKFETKAFFLKDFPGEQNICGICLEPIKEGSQVAVLQCFHFFHPECAAKWIKARRNC